MKYHLITMGCPKNKVDSDGIEMLLQGADYRATTRAQDADVLIVNTCGFLEAAKEESIGVLKELGAPSARTRYSSPPAAWRSATATKSSHTCHTSTACSAPAAGWRS